MKLIITKSGHEKSWYQDSVGQVFEIIEPPTWALGGDEYAYYVKHFENAPGQAMFVWKEDCELVLPQAIETNESPRRSRQPYNIFLRG